MVGLAFSVFLSDNYLVYIDLLKNSDVQNWNVDTSTKVDPLETDQEVIGGFITLRSLDFKNHFNYYNYFNQRITDTKLRQQGREATPITFRLI